MTSENYKEIFQLIKDDTTIENTKLKTNSTQTKTSSCKWLFINKEIIQEFCWWVLFFLLNNEQLKIYFLSCFCLLVSFFSNHLSDFFSPQKLLIKSSIH